MKNLFPKLYIGPMSKNVVDVAINLDKNIGFCISRRQIEYNGGYVNGWTTSDFAKYIKERSSSILVRDHGGPGQGIDNKDSFISFECDAKFMDIIHIDPWKNFSDIKSAINKTVECIEFCNKVNDKCLYEVGTEEAIRRMTEEELHSFLTGLKIKLGEELFRKILYTVIQSGTSLKEDRNTGDYDEERLKRMISICKEFSVLSKEHNGDYLSATIIKEKFDLGLDAINIAPEFGIIETLCILDRVESNTKLFNEIYKLCYESGKWKKWVSDNFDPFSNKRQLIKICCHYIFSDKRFEKIMDLDLFDGINDEIKSKIKNRMVNIIS